MLKTLQCSFVGYNAFVGAHCMRITLKLRVDIKD